VQCVAEITQNYIAWQRPTTLLVGKLKEESLTGMCQAWVVKVGTKAGKITVISNLHVV